MDASLFILFPTGDEVIGLPLTEEGLRDLVAPLMSVKKYARQNRINLRIFFDKNNVNRFKTDVGGVVDKAAYLSKASVILRNFVSSNSTDVQKNAILEGNYNYIRWDTIECMAHQDVALVVKSAFESPGAPCVLSLSPGIPTDYKQVTIIKDRTYDDGRPELKNIPLFFSADGDGQLVITQETNANNPITKGLRPLLTFDIWEHAYYLGYQNRRSDHLAAMWQIVNWDVVEQRNN